MSKKVKSVLWWVLYLLVLIILARFITMFVMQRAIVNGGSMKTTLDDGDNVLTDKFTYRVTDPKRYDIVVFPYQESETYYIKRIIGLPGETVDIINGDVYIDEQRLSDDVYGHAQIRDLGDIEYPFTLGDDEYFVMGDNRNNSHDSRYTDVGMIKKNDLIGKVIFRIWPINKIGTIN